MTRSTIRWTILCTATAIAGAVGIVAWHLRPQHTRFVTDAGAIRIPAELAETRDVRWHPPVVEAPLRSALDSRDPVLDASGRVIYLSRGRAGADADIYVAELGVDGWSAPRPLAAVNSGADELGPHPGPDGRSLYFASDRPGGVGLYDLWVTRRGPDGEWQPPENLGPSVNSPYNDHAPAPAPNGRLLCFASNRPRPDAVGVPGPDAWPSEIRAYARQLDDDLYFADLGDPSAAAPAALAELNTTFDDTAPSLSPAGDFVYFSSNRPGGTGGFDLYRSRRARGAWLAPVGLGEGVNSAADELDPSSSLGGFGLHFATDRGAPADAAEEKRYEILATTSREVFTETETYRARLDMGLIWEILRPYMFALAVMAIAVAGLVRALRSIRHRGLSLIVQALIGSIVVHMVLLVGFAFWSVTGSRGVWTDGGTGVAVVFVAPPALGAPAVAMSVGFMSTEAVIYPADAVDRGEADVEAPPATEVAALGLDRAAIAGPDGPTVAADGRDAPPLEAGSADVGAAAPPELGAVELALSAPAAPAERAAEARAAHGAVVTVANLPGAAFDDAADPGARAADAAVAVAPSGVATDHSEQSLAKSGTDSADAARPALAIDAGRGTALAALPPLPLPALREAQHSAAPADAPGPRAETVASAAARRATRGAEAVAAAPGAGEPDAAPRSVALSTASRTPDGVAESSLAPRGVPESAATAARTASLPGLSAAPGPAAPARLASLPSLTLPGLREQRSSTAAHEGDERPATSPEGLVGALAAAAVEAPASLTAAAPKAAIAPARSGAAALDPGPAPAAPAAARDVAAPRGGAGAPPPSRSALAGAASVKLQLPAPAAPGAAARAEAGPSLPGDAAPAARDLWAVDTRAPGAPAARPAPIAVAAPPQSMPVKLADLAQPVPSQSVLAFLDHARPKAAALDSLDLELALPKRLIPIPFQQRAQDKRREILQEMGGDVRTEEAVVRALDWLARHQSPDGHWDCTEYDDRCGSCRGMGQARADIALTGLSLMCFLAVDHTPDKKGPHRETVARALDWLMRQQKPGGNLMGGDIESMYSHGIATIALAEAYGMTGDERYEQPVKRAVEFIHRSQAMTGGGWRYTPGQAGDTSVTGWQVMALAAARQANIAVPDGAFEVGALWMDRLADPAAPGIYSYQPSYEPSVTMTAEGMFIRQLLGVPRYDLAMRASARHIAEHLPHPDAPPNSYYWYYATVALFQHQGDEWKAWNEALKPMLLSSQVTEGRAAGSWAIPVGDRWANVGGRVYQTAICTLTLEVYYRYLPRFLQIAGGVAPE